MGYIRLTGVTWLNNLSPSSPKVCKIEHKVTGAATYITPPDSTTTVVAVDGSITPAFDILGLADEASYTVRISAICGGASAEHEYTTGMICPNVATISGTGGAGAP